MMEFKTELQKLKDLHFILRSLIKELEKYVQEK